MPTENEHTSQQPATDETFSYVYGTARIATYDDLRSAPRITEIGPNETNQYIMDIATQTYEQAKLAGGHIPFTIIKEVSENFIHARFTEIIVSILDGGNTIRFADQGPGIADKDKAQRPGFSSAVQAMKPYIRGVGSGLPIVKDYFDETHGTITIEDNISSGAVVTISLLKDSDRKAEPKIQPEPAQATTYIDPALIAMAQQAALAQKTQSAQSLVPPLTDREKTFIKLLKSEGVLGVSELHEMSGIAMSSTHAVLKKLEEAGLVERASNQKKRTLSEFGTIVANSL